MTCINCSTAIERGITSEFKDKGLVFDKEQNRYMVNVVLLMHKMKIIFYKQLSITNKVTGQGVADEVEDLGFGAELINTFEVQQESEDIQKSAFERKKL